MFKYLLNNINKIFEFAYVELNEIHELFMS